MEIQGKIIQVLPLRTGTSQRGTAWKVQEYVLETFDQFPRKVLFNFFGDRADQYPLQPGDNVVISFDLESRSFMGRDGVERWSTDVRAYRAEKFDPSAMMGQYGAQSAPQQFAAAPAAQPYAAAPAPQQYSASVQPAPAVGQFPGEAPTGGEGLDNLPF